jgi:hypothetical protein
LPQNNIAPPTQINVHYHHTHTFQAHLSATASLSNLISRVTNPMFNTEAGNLSNPRPGTEFSSATRIVEIPELQLIATIDEVPDPPAVSYAHDLPKLLHDWDFALLPQIGNISIPLKYWCQLYRWNRPDIWKLKKEVWSQWRVSYSHLH